MPVFIVGHPRSGTTLLQLLLTTHPRFYSGPETHLFSYVLSPLQAHSNIPLSKKQLAIILERLDSKPGIQLDSDFKTILFKISEKGNLRLPIFIDELMKSFTVHDDNPEAMRWIEKTPRHIGHIPEILACFPDARIVNIIRDPRDVVSSNPYLLGKYPRSRREFTVIQRSRRWRDYAEIALTYQSSEQFISIRYEDLILNTWNTMKEIMQFLGEDPDLLSLEDFTENYDRIVLPEEEQRKDLLRTGKIVDRRGQWQKRLSSREAGMVEAICAPSMPKNQYDLKICAGNDAPKICHRGLMMTLRFAPVMIYFSLRSLIRRLIIILRHPRRSNIYHRLMFNIGANREPMI